MIKSHQRYLYNCNGLFGHMYGIVQILRHEPKGEKVGNEMMMETMIMNLT